MFSTFILLHWIVFALALWLGLYLIVRSPGKRPLRYTAFGLLAYAGAVVASAFAGNDGSADPAAILTMERLGRGLLLLPVLCWSLTILHMRSEDSDATNGDMRYGDWSLAFIAPQFLIGGILFDTYSGGYLLLQGIALLFLAIAVGRTWYSIRRAVHYPRRGITWTLVFLVTLSAGILALSFEIVPPLLGLVAVGVDLFVLGGMIAAFDAFDEGERLRPDMARSLLGAQVAVLAFGGLVLLDMLNGGASAVLLFGVTALAITLQVLSSPFQTLIDSITLGRSSTLRHERANLRAAAEAVSRLDPAPDFMGMDEDEFIRLTRRAISHMVDLPRLAASPLTQLRLVEARLNLRGTSPETLERAAALKTVLAETIAYLKPEDKGDFGSTAEWRHYNALHFPYVVGLRPYSQGVIYERDGLNETDRAALAWFREQVPDRTLRHWQNAAARLVALHLLEQEASIPSITRP